MACTFFNFVMTFMGCKRFFCMAAVQALPHYSVPVWPETKRLELDTINLSMGSRLSGTVLVIFAKPPARASTLSAHPFSRVSSAQSSLISQDSSSIGSSRTCPPVTFMKLRLQSKIQSIEQAYPIDWIYGYEHGFTKVIGGPQTLNCKP